MRNKSKNDPTTEEKEASLHRGKKASAASTKIQSLLLVFVAFCSSVFSVVKKFFIFLSTIYSINYLLPYSIINKSKSDPTTEEKEASLHRGKKS